MEYINEFHKEWIERTRQSIASWSKQPASLEWSKKADTERLNLTESYKGKQTEELIKFADSNKLWIDIACLSVIYLDRGGENEVFYNGEATIYKLNNFEYAGDDLENFFIRINAHNRFFSNVPYHW